MKFAVAIEVGTDTSAYGAAVPDLPGVFSAGDNLEEALTNTREAILWELEGMIERGEALPATTELEWMVVGKDGKGGPKKYPRDVWGWFVVDVDVSKFAAKSMRLNISLPEPLVKAIDAYTGSRGETRSGFLARAAQSVLNA